MDELAARIRALEARQRVLEDELEIRDLLARYGIYADVGDHDAFVGLFTADGGMELHGGEHSGTYPPVVEWEGQDALREFIGDPRVHMRIEGRCMHIPTANMRTVIDGDRAIAETCSLVIVDEGGAKVLYEAGFTRWRLRREDGRWKIERRIRYGIGTSGFTPS
jgi:hypothetical protein